MSTRMRAYAERNMRDEVAVGTITGATRDDPGGGTWSYAAAIKGSVQLGKSKEVLNGAETTITDGIITIPSGTVLAANQRLKVTKRHRITLGTAEIYTVVGLPQNSKHGIVANVSVVTGNVAP